MAKPIPILLLAVSIGLACVPVASAQQDVAIAVNSSNPIVNLTLADLRKIFAGEKRSWPRNIPVKLIVRAPGSHERLVLLHLLNKSESEYKQYWIAQVLRGEADAEPATVPSVGMQREAMKVFPGAITLVDFVDVKPEMKVVKVDGHLPGEPGYTLH
jgi:ABC-type phosphate transport system substrate-binding protein